MCVRVCVYVSTHNFSCVSGGGGGLILSATHFGFALFQFGFFGIRFRCITVLAVLKLIL